MEAGFWQQPACYLNVRSYLGLRIALIKQNIITDYDNLSGTPSILNVPQSANTDSYSFMMGCNSRYQLGDGFFLTTRSSIGALYGMTDFHTIDVVTNSNTTYLDGRGRDYQTTLSVEMSGGLEYFLCNQCGSDLTLSIRYELHGWQGFTDFLNTASNTDYKSSFMRDQGSLLLHGLVAKLEASF